jgi:hypothetical protein
VAEESETGCDLEGVFNSLRQRHIVFTGPGVVDVASWISRTTDRYRHHAQVVAILNDGLQKSPPGAIIVPLLPEEVDAALAAMERGDFTGVESDASHGAAVGVFQRVVCKWNADWRVKNLASAIGAALTVLIDQLPPDHDKEAFKSLEGVSLMLNWCKEHPWDEDDDA